MRLCTVDVKFISVDVYAVGLYVYIDSFHDLNMYPHKV